MTARKTHIQIALLAAMFTAGGAISLSAQGVSAMTRVQFTSILAEVQQYSSIIDTLNRDILRHSRSGVVLAEAIKAHNEEPCETLSTHPEMCLEYHDEEMRLNQTKDSLLKQWKNSESDRRRARGYFGELMERLRSAEWTGPMAAWKAPVVSCTNIENMTTAANCLRRELAKHP